MVAVDIWVEGVADQKFVADILNKWYGLSVTSEKKPVFECQSPERHINIKVRIAGSVDAFTQINAWNKIKPDFQDNTNTGRKNLIIADIDDDFEQRRAEITGTVTDVGFDAKNQLYLWPENQPLAEKGDLERLLKQIVKAENLDFFECWGAYADCLNIRTNPYHEDGTYFVPDRKAELYAYIAAYTGNNAKATEAKRDYLDDRFWSLDDNSVPLSPLKQFLDVNLSI